MSHIPERIDFRENVAKVPASMPRAIQHATGGFLGKRQAVVDVLGDAYWQQLRTAGHEVRMHTLENLDHYLTKLEERVTAAGGVVHWARDGAEAKRIVLQIAKDHGVKRIVKVKSMISEEIALNSALEEAGYSVRETDLGEYIIQLAGQGPSHIIGPAIHMSKEEVAKLFCDKLGVDAPPDPQVLAAIARTRLREEFLSADMGISGANFCIAETGSIVLVTNEGNGRMCTTVPKLHVAVTSIDKVLPDFEALEIMLKLLGRSGTGQKLSSYTSIITAVHRDPAENGPEEFHLVLMDNGRTRMLRDELYRQTLICIRCGACMNTCPVYNMVGGHAYGWVYAGPIGAILVPQIIGTKAAGDLPYASTLCGACAEICPIKIPIPEILLQLRHRVVEGDEQAEPVISEALRQGVTAGTLTLRYPWIYSFGTQMLKYVQAPFRDDGWLPNLPSPLSRWTQTRPMPAFGADFRSWFHKRTPEGRARELGKNLGMATAVTALLAVIGWWIARRQSK